MARPASTVWDRSSTARPTASICRSPPDMVPGALRAALLQFRKDFVDAFKQHRDAATCRCSGVAPSKQVVLDALLHEQPPALRRQRQSLRTMAKALCPPIRCAAETDRARMHANEACDRIQRGGRSCRRRWSRAARPRCPRGPRATRRKRRSNRRSALPGARASVAARSCHGTTHQFDRRVAGGGFAARVPR